MKNKIRSKMANGRRGTNFSHSVAVKDSRKQPPLAKRNSGLLLSSLRLITLGLLILTGISCVVAEPVVLIGLIMGLSSPALGRDCSSLLVIAFWPVLIFISVWLLIGWLERKRPRYFWMGPIVIALAAITFVTARISGVFDLLYHILSRWPHGLALK